MKIPVAVAAGIFFAIQINTICCQFVVETRTWVSTRQYAFAQISFILAVLLQTVPQSLQVLHS